MPSLRIAALIALCATVAIASRGAANPDVREDALRARPVSLYVPEKVVVASDGTLYGIAYDLGLAVSTDQGQTWQPRNAGLPRKLVYPFDREQGLRPLTAVAVDPVNPQRVAVTTSQDIYASEDGGVTWNRVPTFPPNGERQTASPGTITYLTAVARSPFSRDAFLIGTSFDGFYETTDRGRTWSDPSSKFRFLDRGAHFFEEIAGISYDPTEPGVIVFGVDFGNGVYRSSADREKAVDLEFPGAAAGENIRVVQQQAGGLRVVTDRSVWKRAAAGWERVGPAPAPTRDADPARDERLARAANHTGIYVSAYTAGRPRFDELLTWTKQQGMDSIVIDFKDDDGIVTYDSSLELPRTMGIVRKRFDAREVISKAHAAGIYVIARILVFKDRAMYTYRDGAYAAWDRTRNAPWRNLLKREDENKNVTWVQVEFWVDPYAEFVWDHNIAIAREVQDLGVDEVQFDYIRFATDGDLSTIQYRFQKAGQIRFDALESFLSKARRELHVPISTDLYGFNSWYRKGHWNGQSIELASRYVDVIAPMYYPSHFPSDFLRQIPYIERAKKIYQEGTARSASIVEGRSVIRPYVQAFRIGGELKMTPAEYANYLRVQLEGSTASHASGFTLWNASNDYYMAAFPLTEFLPPKAAGPMVGPPKQP
jgi:hypothetical protein